MEKINKLEYFVWMSLLTVIFGFLSQTICAQQSPTSSVQVNTMVRPPFGTDLYQYPDQTRVIVTSSITTRGSFTISIKGNNGIDLRTAPDYAPPIITVTANQMNQFSGIDLSPYFNPQNLISRGIPMQQIIDNGLPEGSYQVCVRMRDLMGNFISTDEPSGCSNYFNIRYGDPPMTINPHCGVRITQSLVQNIVFSWTPATNARTWAQYTLKIVELLDSTQNPNAAMLSATQPAFFETTLQGAFSFLYGPSQPLLEKGRIYAWQVIAEDRESGAKFANNGRSPVCWFKWDPIQMPIFSIDVPAEPTPDKPKFSVVTNPEQVPISTIKGTLNYKFKPFSLSIGQSQPSNTTSSGDGLIYNQDNINSSGAKPLPKVKVSLVLTYVLKGKLNNKTYNGQPIDITEMIVGRDEFMKDFPDHEKVLATTTTAPDGSFTFMFMNTEQKLGIVDDNADWYTGTVEFNDKFSGKMYKVIRLRIEDKYYCSPDMNIKLEPWQALNLGTVVSYVKSYSLMVHAKWVDAVFWDSFNGKAHALDNVKTSLIRKQQVIGLPNDEGGAPTGGPFPLSLYPKVLKSGATNKDGIFLFHNLVQHDPDNNQDRYHIKCEPDKVKGMYIFKEKEKSYYPLYNKDKKNFPYNSLRPISTNSNIPSTEYYGQDITWNSQLQVKMYEMTIEIFPGKPRVAGKVEVEQVGGKPLSNVNLMLLSNYTTSSNSNVLVRNAKTDANGYYEFDNLDVELGKFGDSLKTEIKGPKRTLFCSPTGYKLQTRELNILLWGQQEIRNFYMEPNGLLAGYVVDAETGNAVAAKVQIDDLAFASTQMQYEFQQSGNSGGGGGGFKQALQVQASSKQVFSIKAPSGKDRILTIQPTNSGYSTETYEVDVPKASTGSNPEIKEYVVYKMKKRIRFMVAQKPAGGQFAINVNLKPVANAEVVLNVGNVKTKKISNGEGYVEFEFENNGKSFEFKIYPPDNVDLENGIYVIHNVEDRKTSFTYPPALLNRATRIAGKVTVGDEKTPLEGATVFIEQGRGNRIETKTKPDGTYLLTKVPTSPSKITLWASKPNAAPNIISQSKQIDLSGTNNHNFVLQTENEIIIENIFGFHVDIKTKEKQGDDTWLISGALINLPSNANFETSEEHQTLPFANLKIKNSGKLKAGIPIGIPADQEFETDLSSLYLLAQKSFGAVQMPSTGSLLKVSSGNHAGQLKGKIGIRNNSFQYSENYITFQEDIPFYLTEQPGSSQSDVASLSANPPPAKKYGITGKNNTDVQFKFLEFNASADKTKSWMEGDRISLSTVIMTNEIPGMSPSKLSLAIGDLSLRPSKIDPITGKTPIAFKLEKWDVQSSGWSIQQTRRGIFIPQGTIKTGLIDVPAKNMLITPNKFEVVEFDMQNLSFSGVAPLKILTQNRSFGYNPSTGSDLKGHWELRIIGTEGSPGVALTGLPGMEPGAEMKFQLFSLLSNGEQKIDLGNQQQELVFHKILKVKPMSFLGGDKYFNMSCSIDLDIPRVAPGNGMIRFSKPGNHVIFEIFPFNVGFDGPGGIKFISGNVKGDQNLTTSGFTAAGTIKDKEGISLYGKLHRTQSAIWLEVDPKNQKMQLGGGLTSLNNIEGSMQVVQQNQDWSKFKFSGDLSGFNGMQSDVRKTFTVHGSITADNEKLGVKNISGSFAGMNLTYDIQKARLIGNMDVDKHVGAMRMKGAANILVDASGWYFLMGGQLTAPGFGNMASGMLIGDYKVMSPDVTQTLMQFAYNKNVPATFKSGVSGFFFTGQKDVPIINIPHFEIDLGIINASLGLTAGLDGRVWMGFNGNGNEYGIGAMAFAHAWFSASSITCTKLSAEARAELGAMGVYQTNNGTFTVAGCGSFTVSGSASQCFPTPCWDGLCCGSCISGSISKGIKLDLLFNSQGHTKLDFCFGNCSGQATMADNW